MGRKHFPVQTGLWVLAVVIGALTARANADMPVTASVDFDKRPPRVGVLYVPADRHELPPAEIDQIDKTFTQSLVVAAPGGSVTFKNSDDVNHNVFANDIKNGASFDIGLMSPGGETSIPVNWKEQSVIRVGCKIHPKMRTYIATFPAAFYRVVEFRPDQKNYAIDLSDLPDNAEHVILRIPNYEQVVIDLNDKRSWSKQIVKKGKPRGQIVLSSRSGNGVPVE